MIKILKLSLDEFLLKFLPADHNTQDIEYLKARYKWENAKENKENEKEAWIEAAKAYKGTTFEKRR